MNKPWRLLLGDTYCEVKKLSDTEHYYGQFLEVVGPTSLNIIIDYGDVDHERVIAESLALVKTLNKAHS